MRQTETSKNKSIENEKENVLEAALKMSERAKNYFFAQQKEDFHWCAELESNSTITAEYVFMCTMLQIQITEERKRKIIKYFTSHQKADGSWGIAWNTKGDVSSTAETYLALRILGLEITDDRMKKAEEFILNQGGLEKVRIFTRINFACFGLFPWDAVPIIPPEFILIPPQSPVNIYTLASWARGTMVPLFIIFHHKPIFALPNGKSKNNDWLDHLWLNSKDKNIPYTDPVHEILIKYGLGWKSFFGAADIFLHTYEKLKTKALAKPFTKKLREHAVKKCEEWVLEHQEKSGDWAGIFPPMVNGVIALFLNGYGMNSDPMKLGLEAIENFAIDDEEGFRVQACESPVWDTILGMIGLVDCGVSGKDSRLANARKWIMDRQLLVNYGDWKIYNPNGVSGGWSFEYSNTWYPDVDDTAAIVIGFLKQDPESRDSTEVRRAVEWIVSMQNPDGGWAAFDVKNDKTFLNQIPFSDMDSLCDPSSPDVAGRVIEALGILDDRKYDEVVRKGIQYLQKTQETQGSWYGRWGVNYVYGTSNVLCSLKRVGFTADDPMVKKAVQWLLSVQNADGGWGECLESYADKSLMGKGASTASQTAWALMALLAFMHPAEEAIEKGILWLIKTQKISGEQGWWDEREFTGTGFPNHFYLRYHMYRHYFPMMAIGRYCSARMT